MMMTYDEDGRPMAPAGFWRRLFAGLFDCLLLATAAAAMLAEMIGAVNVAEHYGWAQLDSLGTQIVLGMVLGASWVVVSAVLFPIAYFTMCEGAFGQTVGKCLFSIRVVSAGGDAIGYGRAFARLLTLPYSFIPIGIGFLWAALPPAKHAWHDYISATQVVSAA
jgi:uncharacterized RDD family membrane protein YckC